MTILKITVDILINVIAAGLVLFAWLQVMERGLSGIRSLHIAFHRRPRISGVVQSYNEKAGLGWIRSQQSFSAVLITAKELHRSRVHHLDAGDRFSFVAFETSEG